MAVSRKQQKPRLWLHQGPYDKSQKISTDFLMLYILDFGMDFPV